MISRRQFMGTAAIASGAAGGAMGTVSAATSTNSPTINDSRPNIKPVVLSTWKFGKQANAESWKVLSTGGRALDAVEKGVRLIEADADNPTVGIGGYPDASGVVTLDACIMDEEGNCGSVAAIQDIVHPISVARMVMEQTPHVMLVGEGAKLFALENGMKAQNLLTPQAKAAYEKWKSGHPDAIKSRTINIENHDTIGLVALDSHGNLSGACTTSGLAWKLPGRVGDSPIIGAGLYVDNEVGAATATGTGEAVMRAVGSFLVVELMRQGHSPEDACRLATQRVISRYPAWKEIQVGFIALNKQGETGGFCIQPGFEYAVQDANGSRLIKGKSHV